MKCPRCNAILDDDTAFCGNCGTQIAPLQAPGATVATSVENEETLRVSTNAVRNRQQPPIIPGFSPRAAPYVPTPDTPPQNRAPQAPRRGGSPLATARSRVMLALALIVLVGGGLGLFVALRNNGGSANLGANATGQIAFNDSSNGTPGHTDALTMSIQKLEAPPSGSQYDAWLVNN